MLTGATVSVRRALDTDRELLFRWANDPLTRANSFEPDPIPWASHCAWFDAVLNDPSRSLYVLLTPRNEPIGQARFDRCGEREATVSMSLGSEWRERALAAPAISAATEHAMIEGGFDVVHAFIKPDNEASVRAFTRAGYQEWPSTEFKGLPAVHLVATQKHEDHEG